MAKNAVLVRSRRKIVFFIILIDFCGSSVCPCQFFLGRLIFIREVLRLMAVIRFQCLPSSYSTS